MIPLYQRHGLVSWSDREIRLRTMMVKHFAAEINLALVRTNPAWRCLRIETPTLIPKEFVNPNYTEKDIYIQTEGDLVLRPETTPGTYLAAQKIMDSHEARPPVCIWQLGKSYRRESNEMSYGHMRLDEFYQLEFQCIYTADSKNDYYAALLPKVHEMIQEMVSKECRIVESDRLPTYSEKTMDVEAKLPLKWMELCSVSLRTDYPGKYNTKEMKVVEIAIGIDRCIHAFEIKGQV